MSLCEHELGIASVNIIWAGWIRVLAQAVGGAKAGASP